MCSRVFLEIVSLCERDITYVTPEQFFAGMCSRVSVEGTSISERGITLQAREGFLATVNQQVSLQICQFFARVVALAAPMGLLLVLQMFFLVAHHVRNLHFHALNLFVVDCSGQHQCFGITECIESWEKKAEM